VIDFTIAEVFVKLVRVLFHVLCLFVTDQVLKLFIILIISLSSILIMLEVKLLLLFVFILISIFLLLVLLCWIEVFQLEEEFKVVVIADWAFLPWIVD
jgi:hypothetical protein